MVGRCAEYVAAIFAICCELGRRREGSDSGIVATVLAYGIDECIGPQEAGVMDGQFAKRTCKRFERVASKFQLEFQVRARRTCIKLVITDSVIAIRHVEIQRCHLRKQCSVYLPGLRFAARQLQGHTNSDCLGSVLSGETKI